MDTSLFAKLDNVSLTYDGGATWALDDISLEITQGERICILGANGSGKSTLAQVLTGLEAPDKGAVLLLGTNVFDGEQPNAHAYREARRGIGLVFQNPEDQIVTSIAADDVAFGPENLGVEHTEIVERVNKELARVALSSLAESDPARFSGGQQQRLAIAGALAMHPHMLVLDEPGAMLDVRGRRGIMRVLDELQAAGTTLVHITHFMDEVPKCTRTIVMNKGKIVLDGTPDYVLSQTDKLSEAHLLPNKNLALSGTHAQQPQAQAIPTKSQTAQTQAEAKVQAKTAAQAEVKTEAKVQAKTTQTTALTIEDVSYSYGKTSALKNISFRVTQGSVCALIGHTGSGKSTLARLICALDQPNSGHINVHNIDTTDRKRRRELRSTIGYVMQLPERQLFAETVYEDIAFGPRNLHLSEDEVHRRVEAQLEYFGLASKHDVSPFELSGGQQRLVALAGVLAMEPNILVFDEPTAGLDPAGAARIKELIADLAASGKTILMITHSMDNVAELASQVIALNHGKIALQGTPLEVFTQAEELHRIGLGVPSKQNLTHLGALPAQNSQCENSNPEEAHPC